MSALDTIKKLADDGLFEATKVSFGAGDISTVQDALEQIGTIARSLLSLESGGADCSTLAAAQPQSVATHRHKKRGTEYVLIGFGKMQAENWVDLNNDNEHKVDMREVAIYQSVDDDELWVRPIEEWKDGRFDALAAPAQQQEGGGE